MRSQEEDLVQDSNSSEESYKNPELRAEYIKESQES
jgi:hypothetical protein